MHNLNENQTAIISIISKFGCMSLQQVYDLLPSYSHKALQTFVTQLVKGHYIDIVDESYLVPYGKKANYSHKTIDSLWVIMRLAHNKCFVPHLHAISYSLLTIQLHTRF